jgi:hypothetical protein
MHKAGWSSVNAFTKDHCPAFGAKTTTALSEECVAEFNLWVDTVVKVIGDGVRRRDNELHIYYCNLTAMGIVTSIQIDWLVKFLLSNLTLNRRNSIAILINPNRAQEFSKEHESPAKLGIKIEPETDEKLEAKDESESGDEDGASLSVRDVVSLLHKKLSEKGKGLEVQEYRMLFKSESVYGIRKGFHDGFLVMAADKGNIFRTGSLWRRGIVENIEMLARKDSRRPTPRVASRAELINAMRLAVTPVQVGKQASKIINSKCSSVVEVRFCVSLTPGDT